MLLVSASSSCETILFTAVLTASDVRQCYFRWAPHLRRGRILTSEESCAARHVCASAQPGCAPSALRPAASVPRWFITLPTKYRVSLPDCTPRATRPIPSAIPGRRRDGLLPSTARKAGASGVKHRKKGGHAERHLNEQKSLNQATRLARGIGCELEDTHTQSWAPGPASAVQRGTRRKSQWYVGRLHKSQPRHDSLFIGRRSGSKP